MPQVVLRIKEVPRFSEFTVSHPNQLSAAEVGAGSLRRNPNVVEPTSPIFLLDGKPKMLLPLEGVIESKNRRNRVGRRNHGGIIISSSRIFIRGFCVERSNTQNRHAFIINLALLRKLETESNIQQMNVKT